MARVDHDHVAFLPVFVLEEGGHRQPRALTDTTVSAFGTYIASRTRRLLRGRTQMLSTCQRTLVIHSSIHATSNLCAVAALKLA
eukprot:840506-Rhodomonas_salina.1